MLKRSGAILLTLLYTITVLGFALNLHYCGNQIASVNIDKPAISCQMDKMPGKMKCCKDIHLQVKVKDTHQAESPSFLSKLVGFELSRVSFEGILPSPHQSVLRKFFDRAPPDNPLRKVASFIKNCIFRI